MGKGHCSYYSSNVRRCGLKTCLVIALAATLFIEVNPMRTSWTKIGLATFAVLSGWLMIDTQAASSTPPIPILFDTDIGTDIDDAFALALVMKSPELRLLGITTVSGDAKMRARLAAKLLWVAGGDWRKIPVYAGIDSATQPIDQGRWADGFTSRNLHLSGGVAYLRDQIDHHPGEITVVAVGELTNIAALLAAEPGIAKKIKRFVLMGGAIARGYGEGSAAVPEWNIKSNVPAAQAVFASGVPITMAPLDATIALKLEPAARAAIFSHGTPLTDALAALTSTWQTTNSWKGDTPTLFDAMAVAMMFAPNLAPTETRCIEIDPTGLTRVVADGRPNAEVALSCDPKESIGLFVRRIVAP